LRWVSGEDRRLAAELGPDRHPEARQVDEVALGQGRHEIGERAGILGRRLEQEHRRDVRPDSALKLDPEALQILGRHDDPEPELAALGRNATQRARVEVLDLVDVQGVRGPQGRRDALAPERGDAVPGDEKAPEEEAPTSDAPTWLRPRKAFDLWAYGELIHHDYDKQLRWESLGPFAQGFARQMAYEYMELLLTLVALMRRVITWGLEKHLVDP
jgi:hypothetical protein